ncbi:Na/Pi symporter [Falsibacillus albus]|nr:Na/Pi symporter [Falsibacillus albus]
MLVVLFCLLIVCFILGMTWMRIGLYNLSGKQLKGWMHSFTASPLKGMAAGTVATGILHSSSAVMVMTVGFVSAGILTFPQSIGIILGTNIGTTFTLEFISFPIDAFIIPSIIAGACLLAMKQPKLKSLGWVLVGLGMIFTAMRGFEWLAQPLFGYKFVQSGFSLMNRHLLYSMLFGIILTAIVQSSTATTGMMMSFLQAGIVPLESGIAFMIGANIGTCITGLIAAVGANKEAKRTAYAHIWLNVGGAILFYPMIHLLGEISSSFTTTPSMQLAHASVIYNLVCSLLVLPFAEKFGRLIMKVH